MVLLLGVVIPAAAAPRITAVEVEAVRRPPAVLQAILHLRVGDPYSADRADADLKRLYATGAFDDVRLEVVEADGGVRLVYHCVDRTFLRRLHFTDHRFPVQTLRQAVGLAAGTPLDREVLAGAPERLRALYRGEGYPQVLVAADVDEAEAERSVSVTFRIVRGPPLRLTGVRFTGPLPVARWRLRWVLGLHFGDHLRPAAFDDHAARLTDDLRRRGYLDARVGPITVEAEAGSRWGGLVVPIDSGVRTRVEVEGNHVLSRREVVDGLNFARHTALDVKGRAQMSAGLVDLYRRKGYDDARVEVAEPHLVRRPGEQRLAVHCHEGRRIAVAAIHIETGDGVDAQTIREVMTLARHRSFGRPAWFRRDLFEADRAAIEARLRLLGHYQAHLARYEAHRTDAGMVVDVAVEPGPVAMVTDVTLTGAHTIARDTLLAGLETPAPLLLPTLRDLRRQMVTTYRSRGLLEARVRSHLVPLGEGRWRLELKVEEGAQSHIGATHVRGLDRTVEAVVRRELRYHEGDPFDPDHLHETRQALARLGLFEQVEVAPDPLLAGATVRDVVVDVDEGKQGAVAG